MYPEDELLPLSGLQHLAFCERQWGLIHLEQQWVENLLTAEGRIMHNRSHSEEGETRGDIRIVRGLRVHSLLLGLVGVCDVVEFHRLETEPTIRGVKLPNMPGQWQPTPIEHKRGRPKPDRCDEVQLCAQALCLEEMLETQIMSGAIFYGQPRRRMEVELDSSLRSETETLADRLHKLHELRTTPAPAYSKKCLKCSLLDVCKPKATGSRRAASRYVATSLRHIERDGGNSGKPE